MQEGEVEPVGGRKSVKVDVRIVSATNRDLIADVKAGRFREDLFYRLHVYPIAVPPLRQRPEDIAELARHFLARIAAEEGKRGRSLSAQALSLLSAFRWPGNVRQLENAIFRAVVLAETEEIGVNEFPQIAAQIGAEPDAAQPLIEPSPAMAAAWPDGRDGVAPALTIVPHLLPPHRWARRRAPARRARKRQPSASPSRIIADRCRRLRGDWASGARRFTASSKASGSTNTPPTQR